MKPERVLIYNHLQEDASDGTYELTDELYHHIQDSLSIWEDAVVARIFGEFCGLPDWVVR